VQKLGGESGKRLPWGGSRASGEAGSGGKTLPKVLVIVEGFWWGRGWQGTRGGGRVCFALIKEHRREKGPDGS